MLTRRNPQLKKSYYVAYGQLTKKESSKKTECSYGEMWLTAFTSNEEYESRIVELELNGYSVSRR
jgi:hypothetical protein